MTIEQHNAVLKLLRQQYKELYNSSIEQLLAFDDEVLSHMDTSVAVPNLHHERTCAAAAPVCNQVPELPNTPSVVSPPPAPPAPLLRSVTEEVVKQTDIDTACQIADTQHGNHKFMCLSFANEHAFESATVLLQISVLRSGDISVRTRMRIMRSVQGDVFQNVPALCGPVYHITAEKHVCKESSKELVLPHAIKSMFCIYTLLMTKLRLEAVKRGILAPDYPGHKFDRLPLSRRAETAFESNPLPDLEAGVSVFNEDQFDFVKPVNAALAQLNTMWDYKPTPGLSRKRPVPVEEDEVFKGAECVHE